MAIGDDGEDDRSFDRTDQETPRVAPVARQFVGATVRLSVYTVLSSRMRHGEGPQAMLRTLANVAAHEALEGRATVQEAAERRLVKAFSQGLVEKFESNEVAAEDAAGPVLLVAMEVFEAKSLSFMEKIVLDVSREELDHRSPATFLDEPPHRTAWPRVSEVLRDAAEVLRIGIDHRK